jgi:hypothetical protein
MKCITIIYHTHTLQSNVCTRKNDKNFLTSILWQKNWKDVNKTRKESCQRKVNYSSKSQNGWSRASCCFAHEAFATENLFFTVNQGDICISISTWRPYRCMLPMYFVKRKCIFLFRFIELLHNCTQLRAISHFLNKGEPNTLFLLSSYLLQVVLVVHSISIGLVTL